MPPFDTLPCTRATASPRRDLQTRCYAQSRGIKAPFRMTQMGGSTTCPWLWLWSRRGSSWVIEQEIRSELAGDSIAVRKGA